MNRGPVASRKLQIADCRLEARHEPWASRKSQVADCRLQTLWGPLFIKTGRPPVNDGVRSLAIIHDGIVQGSTWEPWRGPDGCGIHVRDGNTAPDPVSKSEKARL